MVSSGNSFLAFLRFIDKRPPHRLHFLYSTLMRAYMPIYFEVEALCVLVP